VLAAVQKDTPPTIGATLAVLLTIVCLLILLTLVYSTLSQMRPIRVIRVILAIKTRALNARERELELVCRTRRAPRLTGPPQLTGLSLQSGYVTGVDAGAMSAALTGLDDAEVEFLVSLGQHVVVGDPVIHVRGAGEAAGRVSVAFCQQVLELGVLTRDVGRVGVTTRSELIL